MTLIPNQTCNKLTKLFSNVFQKLIMSAIRDNQSVCFGNCSHFVQIFKVKFLVHLSIILDWNSMIVCGHALANYYLSCFFAKLFHICTQKGKGNSCWRH